MSNDICSSVLVDGALYGFDLSELQAKAHRPTRGQFRCIDFLTGSEHWSTGDRKLRRKNQPSATDAGRRIGQATVLVADGKLIMLNDTGELILARATTKRYEEISRVSVLGGEICWTQPTLLRGRLFVRNQSRAACVYVGDPMTLAPQVRAAALTPADIPQTKYVDVAAVILGVEPEAAFDIPSEKWLREWFLISLLGILGASLLVAVVVRMTIGRRMPLTAVSWLFWTTAFVLGAFGTTVLSQWKGEFVFTWQVCIFVAFQAAVSEIRIRRGPAEDDRGGWWPRIVAAMFVVTCVVYFLLCRRLSLVFEWVFLCGFAAALPFALAGALMFRHRRWRFAWQCLMTVAAFSSFYWSAVALLLLKS